ncbi:GNAT family N-acetyltransferase, partial [Treponema sp. OttesenSCG-928-L16]|nr:GNAT family N-acetyltransferase [Treponema sp. OttesenSCG-928-L16]
GQAHHGHDRTFQHRFGAAFPHEVILNYKIRELQAKDLDPDLLKHFNRYQEVKKCWRKINGQWVLKDAAFVEYWNDALKQEVITVDLTNCLKNGGIVWGVFDEENKLIGFASLLAAAFGSKNQYRKLMQLHISHGYRNMGIGKKLFALCAQKAEKMGAEKLYISAHSSEESQAFYTKIGCTDALEIDQSSAEHEPYDRQMEYILGTSKHFSF